MRYALKDVADVVMGQAPPGTSYNESGEGVPFLQGSKEFGIETPISNKWCNAPKKFAETGDILFSVRAPVGDVNVANKRYCIGRGLAAIRCDKNKILRRYFLHSLKMSVSRIQQRGQGTTVQAINKSELEAQEFKIPAREEQLRIVEILDRAENIIRLRQLSIEATQRIASALFYEMFGNPIRNEKGWEAKKIGETCEQDRITYNSERDGQLTFLGLEHITKNTGDIVELSEEEVRGKATTFVFNDTHVLYGKLRPYLNKVVMPTFRGRCTTELIPYLPKPNIGRCYLTYLLRSETIVNAIVSNSTGTRMPRANLNYLERIKVGVPPYEIHKIFEDKLASMNEFLKRQQTSQETSHKLYSALRAQLLVA